MPLNSWVPPGEVPVDPLAEWTRRHLRSHGPTTAADVAFWTGLPLGTVRRGIEAVRSEFETIDEFLLGYADRSAVLAPEHAERVAPGGNGVFRGMLVAGGQVAGTWTRTGDRPDVVPFAELSSTHRAAIDRRARTLPTGRLDQRD